MKIAVCVLFSSGLGDLCVNTQGGSYVKVKVGNLVLGCGVV